MDHSDSAVRAPWTIDPTWFERYAQTTAKLKRSNLSNSNPIRAAFRTVYRAVAFDIDGTLTAPGLSEVTPRMASIVADLLQRSVPVVLITGRGRSAKQAAIQIATQAQLSDAYLRRLYCIIYNGVLLLEHDRTKPISMLAMERQLGRKFTDVLGLRDTAIKVLDGLDPPARYQIAVKEQSIRIEFPSAEDRDAAEKQLQNRLSEYMGRHQLHLTRGAFADIYCLDIGPGNKAVALTEFGRIIGVHTDAILRIGDQGNVGGNDYDLLNHPRGFSVDKFGSDPSTCHPVLDHSLNYPLVGAEAAERLLGLVLLFPPLSLAPDSISNGRLRQLNGIERAAIPAARAAFIRAQSGLNETLAAFDCRPRWGHLNQIPISDVFDQWSGAVRFHDWELDELDLSDSAAKLFGLDHLIETSGVPHGQLCMYSDTGVLLRGPDYYYGWAHRSTTPELYIGSMRSFLASAANAVSDTGHAAPSFSHYKLTLGILDYSRNYLLCLSNLCFLAEGNRTDTDYWLTSDLISRFLLPHTRLHLEAVRGGRGGWRAFHEALAAHLCEQHDWLGTLDIEPLFTERIDICARAIRTRECDHFLENVIAVTLGLQKHLRYSPFAEDRRLRVVGLAYGGIELPIIAAALGPELDADIEPGIMRVSLYDNAQTGALVRSASPGYVDELLDLVPPVCLAGPRSGQTLADRPALIADDNCTTALTLQWARDILITLGTNVRGAIVVRYPRTNRAVHMKMENHGMPDPEILLGFVRGLVSPSPYSRLLTPGPDKESVYRDQSNIFDKSKERLMRYLRKNGTPRCD